MFSLSAPVPDAMKSVIVVAAALLAVVAWPGSCGAFLVDPYTTFAPCEPGLLTCSGRPGTRSICCDPVNQACGVLSRDSSYFPAGSPVCVECPQVCTLTCKPGFECTKDSKGCFACVARPGPPPVLVPRPSPRPAAVCASDGKVYPTAGQARGRGRLPVFACLVPLEYCRAYCSRIAYF